MWRAQAGSNVQIQADEDDDWETDPDFVVSISCLIRCDGI